MVLVLTSGRTEHISELTETEAQRFIDNLRSELNKNRNAQNIEVYERKRKMRGKIIHLLCLLGMTRQGKPDIERINEFIINIGNRNPRKVILNFLSVEELVSVTTQVEALYKKETAK